MNDPDIQAMLEQLVRASHLGDSPKATCLEYLQRTGTYLNVTQRIGAEESGGPMRGDRMVTLEVPEEYFDRLVLNDRRYRKEHKLP